jgi:3'-phosphoadenosine 5'-phosphosulfate sulfotransferase (PAPS reductase)/FAD synthetase
MTLDAVITGAYQILDTAFADHQPSHIYALFSGGYDSLANTHITMAWAQALGIPAAVRHINTRTGVDETNQYVWETSQRQGWPLLEYTTPEQYEVLVLERGFPGPAMHAKMYDRLKGRCIEQMMRDDPKGVVLLSTGVRRSESQRRMGYTNPVDRRGRQLWVNPCFRWSKNDVLDYKERCSLPNNLVVDLLHRSGECNCGAMAAGPHELDELRLWYPKCAAKIDTLARKAQQAGFPWGWGEGGPPLWWAKARAGQMFLPEPEPPAEKPFMPLCVGCEGRHAGAVSEQTFITLENEGKHTGRDHITTMGNKTARAMAALEKSTNDRYMDRIRAAAQRLKGTEYEYYVYVSQYISGTTLWRSMCDRYSISVRADGVLVP